MPDLMTRRELLLTTAFALFTGRVNASNALLDSQSQQLNSYPDAAINWTKCRSQMAALAKANASGLISQQTVAVQGRMYLTQLDIESAEFKHAVDAAYESGNQYWLWQRLIKDSNINGGILSINNDQPVPLHDHPGASGMLRIISGETEVWQFDEINSGNNSREKNGGDQDIVELELAMHRVLKPGDVALLTPEQGNIHALRALTAQCSMLDFFIPPYERSQRSWYKPLTNNWFDKEKVACRKFPQAEFPRA